MADPVTLLFAGAGAALSASQASSQNSAIAGSQASQAEAAAKQRTQLERQGALEREKNERAEQRALGLARVAGAAAGIGGASPQILGIGRQISLDGALNDRIIQENTRNEIIRVNSGAQANIDRLQSGTTSVGSSLLSGGISGFQTGLSISDAIGGDS